MWYHSSQEEALLNCKFCESVRPAERAWRDLTDDLPAGHPGCIPNQFLTEERIEKTCRNPWDKDWRPTQDSYSD
eukprot:2948766-Rhodomonas_salina.3